MKKISAGITLFATSLLLPVFAVAADCGVNTGTGKVTLCTPNTSTASVAAIIQAVTNWILGFGGALAILMIIYGGVIYVTSAGNEKRVTQAKQILTFAIIGLIVILLALVIVQFVATALNAAQTAAK